MPKVNIILPQMGQGVAEAVLIDYKCAVGDLISVDDVVAEIATDKVDTEITSHVSGVVHALLFKKDDVIAVGQTVAVIETPDEGEKENASNAEGFVVESSDQVCQEISQEANVANDYSQSDRFYSPLVKSIARVEGISLGELEQIHGSGLGGRVTKDDILKYLSDGRVQKSNPSSVPEIADEVVPMSRMRRMIAQNMKHSLFEAAHATSISEADVTVVSQWRNKVQKDFSAKYGEKLTYTPIFIMAVAQALKEYPAMNVSLHGDDILYHKSINIGMAVALPTDDLIVPVIHDADKLTLPQIAHCVNDLASRARAGKLLPHEIQGGGFTVTNVGSYGTLMGTPIINLPEVAVLAIGAVKKTPAVLSIDGEDTIAIRSMMYMSMSYDHRVVDGALGGKFMKKISDVLEQWDINMEI